MARTVFKEGVALFNRVMWFGVALLVLGLCTINLASTFAIISHELKANGVVTAATVTNRYVQKSSKGQETFLIQYIYGDSKNHFYRSEVEVNKNVWSATPIGFKFNIIYDPKSPINSMLPGFNRYYENELICEVIGGGSIVSGIYVVIGWIIERRRRIRFMARLNRSEGIILKLTSIIRRARTNKRNIQVPAIEYEYPDQNGENHRFTSEIEFEGLWKKRIEEERNSFELFYDSDSPSDHIFTELNSVGNLVRKKCLPERSDNMKDAVFYLYMCGLWIIGYGVYSFKDYWLPRNVYVLVLDYFLNYLLIIGFWAGISLWIWRLLRCVDNEIQYQDIKRNQKSVQALATAVLEEESFTNFRTPGSKMVYWLQYEYSDKPDMTRYGLCQLTSQEQAFDLQDCLAHGRNNIEVLYDPAIPSRHLIVDRRFTS